MAPTGFETGCSSRVVDPTSGSSLSRHGSPTTVQSPISYSNSSYLSASPVEAAADATDSYSDPGPFYGMFDRCDSDSEDWSNIRLSSPRPGVPRSSMGSLTSSGLVGASETFHKVMQQLDLVKRLPKDAGAAAKEKKDAATSTTRPTGASTRSSEAASATCCTKCGGTKPASTSIATSTTRTSSNDSVKKPTASSAKAASSSSPLSPASASTSSSASSSLSSTSDKASPAGTKERKSSKHVQKSASFSASTSASSGATTSFGAAPPTGGAKPPCCPRCCPPQQQQRGESGKRRMSVPACMRSSKHVQWADEAGVSSLVSVRLIRPRLSKGEEAAPAAGHAVSPRSILRRLTGSVH